MNRTNKTLISVLILAFSCLLGQSTFAASDVSKTTIETLTVIPKKEIQKKTVKKGRFWTTVKSVFSKKIKRPNYKTKGSKTFGIISIVFILPSLFGLLTTSIGLFLIPIPGILLFSILGLILDDEKWPSVISLIYTGIMLLLIMVFIINCRNDDACFGD